MPTHGRSWVFLKPEELADHFAHLESEQKLDRVWKRVDQDGSGGLDRDELRTVLLSKTTRESPYGNGVLVLDSVLRSAGPSVLGNKPEEIDMDATMKAIDLDGSEVRDPHDPMDCNPTRWPLSPRIVMRCAPRASNGPDHLGL